MAKKFSVLFQWSSKKSHNIARIRIFLPFRTVSVTSYMVVFHLLKLQLLAFGTFELQSFIHSPKYFAHSNLEKLITRSSMNPLLSFEKT